MNYHPIKTRPFLHRVEPQDVTENIIVEALNVCFQNTAFSTFPYIMYNMNSKQAMKELKSGNCVALSMYLKDILKRRYGIKSYLIPATIPNIYKLPTLLDICHVALAIPRTKSTVYVADVAFYFLRPIEIKLHYKTVSPIYSKEIYAYEPAQHVEDYVTLKQVQSKIFVLPERTTFNEWQHMPRYTRVCQCCYTENINDTWMYFLREVCNPDRAISTFFINSKKLPFICSTKHDHNGVCSADMYLKFEKYNNIHVTLNSNPNEKTVFPWSEVGTDTNKNINAHIRHFLKGDFSQHLIDIPYEKQVYVIKD